jgi:hypothetical protein
MLQTLDPLFRDAHALNHLLKRNLMGRMIELLFLEPAKVAHGPTLLTRIHSAIA